MNDNKRRNVMVSMSGDLARRSLAAANDAGMSRSELVRQLLAGYLEENGAE